MISLTVIVLRKSQPDLERSFKVPLVPIIPVISMALCAFLASQLDIVTWIVFIIWTCAGMVIYFLYGRKHSTYGYIAFEERIKTDHMIIILTNYIEWKGEEQ